MPGRIEPAPECPEETGVERRGVRHPQDRLPARFQQLVNPRQRATWTVNMLQRILHDYPIKLRRLKLRVVQNSCLDRQPPLFPSHLSRSGIWLDPSDARSQAAQRREQVAGSAADFEDGCSTG